MKSCLVLLLGMFAVAYSAKFHLVVKSTSAKRILQLQRDFELCGITKGTDVWHSGQNQTSFRWTAESFIRFISGLQTYYQHDGVEHSPHTDYENTPELVSFIPETKDDVVSILGFLQAHGLEGKHIKGTNEVQYASRDPSTTRRVIESVAYYFAVE